MPKPLIRVRGRTLLEHTLCCFNIDEGDRLILAVQRSDKVREGLEAKLRNQYPKTTIHWVELDSLLPGQLATATTALQRVLNEIAIDQHQALLIHNCDTGFRWNDSLAVIQGFAAMAVFEAAGEHWSFGLPDPLDPQRAIAIAEKQRISPLASIGLYGFANIAEFLSNAKHTLRTVPTLNGEHYIAPMLQQAIELGKQVQLPRVDGVSLYGTPEELCRTFQLNLETLRESNP